MKKIVLLLLVFNLGFSQNHVIEIKLVDHTIGEPAFNSTPSNTTESNDAGLNAILQSHNVFGYIIKEGHLYPPFIHKFTEAWCDSCNPTQLTNDLLAYSNVVEEARITVNQSPFNDNLYSQIQTLGIGIPIGFTNEIVVTNDSGLNQIFEDFNVYYYELSFPGATTNSLQRFYNVVCDCDNSQLKTALDNYTSIISYTEYPSPIYLLNTTDFEQSNASVAPNPFTTLFNIQTKEIITNYKLIDLSGKELLSTDSKLELDNVSSSLSVGMYILNLQFENGLTTTLKIVKQ